MGLTVSVPFFNMIMHGDMGSIAASEVMLQQRGTNALR